MTEPAVSPEIPSEPGYEEALAAWHTLLSTAYHARNYSADKIGRGLRAAGLQISDDIVASWLAGTDAPRTPEAHGALLHVLGLDTAHDRSKAAMLNERMLHAYDDLQAIGFANAPELPETFKDPAAGYHNNLRASFDAGSHIPSLHLNNAARIQRSQSDAGTNDHYLSRILGSGGGGGLKTIHRNDAVISGHGSADEKPIESQEDMRARQAATADADEYIALALLRGRTDNTALLEHDAVALATSLRTAMNRSCLSRYLLEKAKPQFSENGDTVFAGDYDHLEALVIRARLEKSVRTRDEATRRSMYSDMPKTYWQAVLDHNLHGDAFASMSESQKQQAELWQPLASMDFHHKGDYMFAARMFFHVNTQDFAGSSDVERATYKRPLPADSFKLRNIMNAFKDLDEAHMEANPSAKSVYDEKLMHALPYDELTKRSSLGRWSDMRSDASERADTLAERENARDSKTGQFR